MSLDVLPAGPPCTLAALERETAARVGPFALLEALGGGEPEITVEVLKSTIDLGGYDDLFVLRREATQEADRQARVKAYDPAIGQLLVDRRYLVAPLAGEPVELHHLPPDLLRRGVRAGLRRCYCQFWLPLVGDNGDDPDAPVVPPTGPVDLTDYSGGWLRLPQQVLDVVDPVLDGDSVGGWRVYQHNGRAFLLLGDGAPNAGLSVVASRDHFGLVNGQYVPQGPTDDEDELDLDLFYGAALAHIELWRVARDRLETVAAEGRQATQAEAAAEATRMAAANCPWLFVPGNVRRDRVQPLRGLIGAGGSANGGALAGAWVNGPRGTEPPASPLGAPLGLPPGPGPDTAGASAGGRTGLADRLVGPAGRNG